VDQMAKSPVRTVRVDLKSTATGMTAFRCHLIVVVVRARARRRPVRAGTPSNSSRYGAVRARVRAGAGSAAPWPTAWLRPCSAVRRPLGAKLLLATGMAWAVPAHLAAVAILVLTATATAWETAFTEQS
jgi:hypothetical protein